MRLCLRTCTDGTPATELRRGELLQAVLGPVDRQRRTVTVKTRTDAIASALVIPRMHLFMLSVAALGARISYVSMLGAVVSTDYVGGHDS